MWYFLWCSFFYPFVDGILLVQDNSTVFHGEDQVILHEEKEKIYSREPVVSKEL